MTISSWKVLKIDRNNFTVVLVPSSPTNAHLILSDAQGYNNGVKLLNDACSSLYGNYRGVKARSINLTDIMNLMDSTKKEQILEEIQSFESIKYGETNTEPYTTHKTYPAIFEEEQPGSIIPTTGYSGKILGQEEAKDVFIKRENRKKTAETSINPTNGIISFTYDNLIDGLGDYSGLILPEIITKDSNEHRYWLAKRTVCLRNDMVLFGIEEMGGHGNQYWLDAFYSNNAKVKAYDAAIFPIVELTSGTITVGNGEAYIYQPDK